MTSVFKITQPHNELTFQIRWFKFKFEGIFTEIGLLNEDAE